MRDRLRRRRHRRHRQAGRRRRAPERRAGPARRSSAPWPRPATGSRPPAPPSAQGIVHRLDVGTSGLMVVAKSERAYTALKRAVPGARRSTRSTTRSCRATPTRCAAPSTRRSAGTRARLEVRGRRRRQAERHPLRDARGASARRRLLEIHLETGRTHQIRVHMAALRHPCVGDLTYGADPTLAARLGPDAAVAARRAARLRAPRHRRAGAVREPLPGRPADRARRSAPRRAVPHTALRDR